MTSDTDVRASDRACKRLNKLHAILGNTWRKIALLDEYKGIPAGSLCSYAKGRIPQNNKHRRALGFPEIIKQAVYRSPIGRFRKVGE